MPEVDQNEGDSERMFDAQLSISTPSQDTTSNFQDCSTIQQNESIWL